MRHLMTVGGNLNLYWLLPHEARPLIKSVVYRLVEGMMILPLPTSLLLYSLEVFH